MAAGGPYCNNASSTAPPNSVIGLLTIGGAAAPAGTVVSLAFDGVVGPSQASAAAGGYKVYWTAGGEGCANRVGAAISVVVNGQFFPTGQRSVTATARLTGSTSHFPDIGGIRGSPRFRQY